MNNRLIAIMRALLGTLFALSIAKAAISLWEFRGQSGTFLFAHLRGHGNEASVYSPHSKPAPAATDSTPSEENPSKERSLRGIKAVGTFLFRSQLILPDIG